MSNATLNATVLSRADLTEDLVIFRIACDESIPDFLPGQYVAVGLYAEAPRPPGFPPDEGARPGKLIQRSYSIASPPDEKAYLELYVAIMQQGSLTPRFMLLKEGDRLHVGRKITGTFTLKDIPPASNLVFIATGTGIAPFISMLRTSETWQPERHITLIHGVRHPCDFGYQEECSELTESNPRFKYLRTVSRAAPGWGGLRGYVQECFLRGDVPLDPEQDRVFLCGNPAMIADMEKLLRPRGYTLHSKKAPGNLHVEKYW